MRIRKWFWSGLLAGILLPMAVLGQKPACGSSAWQSYQRSYDPDAMAQEARMNAQLKALTEGMSHERTATDTAEIVIPVVFHIIHDNGPENLADSMAHRALEHLNLAFANEGYYDPTVGVETYFSFCLSRKGKYGEPSNGINRVQDADFLILDSFEDDGNMKRTYSFPTDKVLNVYSVRNIAFATGYATFPRAVEGGVSQGIVMDHDFIGHSARRGAVLAHEVGHFLGLYHTFQDNCRNFDCLLEGDRVCDTPPDATWEVWEGCIVNNNCFSDADDTSDNNPFQTDVPDLNSNYMDYNSFTCMKVFTEGQRTRMRFAARVYRPKLMASEYCNAVPGRDVAIYEVRNGQGLICADSLYPEVRIVNYGSSYLTSLRVSVSVNGGAETHVDWSGQIAADGGLAWLDLPAVPVPGPGIHALQFRTEFPNNFPDTFPRNDTFRTTFWQPYSSFIPFRETFESGWPADWLQLNVPGDEWAFATTGQCGVPDGGNQALYLRNVFHLAPSMNTFISPILNLDLHEDAVLRFDHSFARQDDQGRPQYLEIEVIPYCDAGTAVQVFSESQESMLETIVLDQSFIWHPTICTDWSTSEIDLSPWAGQEILLAFRSDIGRLDFDRLYLDNIEVTSSFARDRAANGLMPEDIKLYPNPSPGDVWLDLPVYAAAPLHLRIYDAAGQLVWELAETPAVGRYIRTLDLSRLAAGMYFLRIELGAQRFMKKLMVNAIR